MRFGARVLGGSLVSILAACGGATVGDSGGDSGADSGADSAPSVDSGADGRGAPDAGPDTGDSSGPLPNVGVNQAIQQLFLGDTDRNGVESTTAWESYGLNIDGKVTTASSTDVCTLYPGSPRETQTDGDDGIDNSFGANIIPLILTIGGGSYSMTLNQEIYSGEVGTTIFALGVLGGGSNYSSLSGASYAADPTSTPPAWNGSDVWPIDSTSVTNGTTPVITFPQSSMTNRVWSSAPVSTTPIPITIYSGLTVPVGVAQITMQVAADNSSATNGVFSGVVNTQALVDAFMTVAARISTSFCSGTAYQSIAQEIEQASDIMSDGTNTPGQMCDGISVGLGFNAAAANLGSVVTLPPQTNPCN